MSQFISACLLAFQKVFDLFMSFKKGSHAMEKYKMLALRLSIFAVNDIVKFSDVLRSMISAAAYSGVFYFGMFKELM